MNMIMIRIIIIVDLRVIERTVIYTAENFKWNKKLFIILLYDMKQKGDDYKQTSHQTDNSTRRHR